MREFIEKLLGGKNKKETITEGEASGAAGAAKDAASPEETVQEPIAQAEVSADGQGLLDHTVIITSDELSDQILQATDNVFEDTLPGKVAVGKVAVGKVAMEETAVGLAKEAPVPTSGQVAGLSAAQCCHIGNVRERNEDSSFLFTAEFGGQEPLLPAGLYIVADGMGGHHAGHKASKNAVRIVGQYVLERIYVPMLRPSAAVPSRPQEPIGEVMVDAVQAANHEIHDSDPKKSSGTTLTAALIIGRRLYMAHVGDSRAYLYREGELKLLTIDHSYVRRLQEAGQLTEEEAAVHPQRNMLYKAVGQGGDLDIDSFTQSLPQTGKLFLCSDGLWGLVSDESIAEVLGRDIPLPAMTDELIMMARIAGGHDNITAIIVDFNL